MSKLELPTTPPKASWLVDGMFPLGHTSVLYAPAGVGKTRIVSHLAAQVTRPEGLFMARQVRRGKVVILDADDPTGYGYAVWLNRFFNTFYDADRTLIDLRAITGGLTPDDVKALTDELKNDPPRLVIVDTFASAFVGLDILRAHHVQMALTGLAELAKELSCAVLCLDHVGKLRPGETVASKGPYGAAKTFSPRAVFALSRVPPKEVEGRDVLRLDCTKQSYAPEPAPLGIEITLEQNDTRARVALTDLPGKTLLENAKAAIIDALRSAKGEPMPRKALLSAAVAEANCTERYAEKALKDLEHTLGSDLTVTELGGRGSPKGYALRVLGSANGENSVLDDELFDEQTFSANQLEAAEDDLIRDLVGATEGEL